MAVFRVKKESNYTIISNYHLQDINLTLKAKGLLTFMLSLPNDWEYSVSSLINMCKENKTAIQSALNELENNKYLTRERIQDDKGRFNYLYTVYELPRIGNLCTENLCTENVPLLNTNILNTNIQNTDINKKEIFNKEKRFKKPTVEEIQEYINSKGYDLDAEHIYNHYETSDWYRGNTKIKDWRAAVRTWNKNKDRFASNNKKKETKYNYDNSEDFTDEF